MRHNKPISKHLYSLELLYPVCVHFELLYVTCQIVTHYLCIYLSVGNTQCLSHLYAVVLCFFKLHIYILKKSMITWIPFIRCSVVSLCNPSGFNLCFSDIGEWLCLCFEQEKAFEKDCSVGQELMRKLCQWQTSKAREANDLSTNAHISWQMKRTFWKHHLP